jgi:GNAT superfamily N-acetyltransferase
MPPVIRPLRKEDCPEVIEMMRVFYASPAVLSNGSTEIFQRDLASCLEEKSGLDGFVFEDGTELVGYAMVAHSYSTEYGGPCLWIEDLYVKPQRRGAGLGSEFLRRVEDFYPDTVIFRLEMEADNRAVHAYTRCGYKVLPYVQMKKHPEKKKN